MSYDTLKSTLGRKPVYIVELDLDYCRLTYGTSPCTAAVGVTGSAKCFNTRKTCQDANHYTIDGVWDPLRAGSGITLDPDGVTATLTGSSTVLGVTGHSTGKHYAEITVGTPDSPGLWVGLATPNADRESVIGTDPDGWGYYGASGIKKYYHILFPFTYGAAFTTGDVIGIAYDADEPSLKMYKNNVLQGTLLTGSRLDGTTPMHHIACSANGGTTTAIINEGATPFAFAPPAGYDAWAVATTKIGIKTYRFSSFVLPASTDLDFIAIPAVSSVDQAPTVIDPNNGIGKRANVVVTLKDFTHPDTDIDKYVTERDYDSGTRGTFWTKLLARNPYYQNRVMRIMSGYLVDGEEPDLANFQTRLYLLQQIDGPDAKGMVRVTAQDPLKLLDDERAKAPLANTGTLLADISDVAFTATLQPTGVGDLEYPTSGVMVMGNELADFTRVGDVITFLSRGTQETVAVAHQANESMQAALSYSGQSITEVLYDLIVTRAGISPDYVDLAAWDLEANRWLSDYTIATTITKPIGLNQLVGELAQQCLFFIWWDERDQTIKFRAIRPLHNEDATTVDDQNNVIADTQSVVERPKDRKTQIWVYYGQRNPTVDLNKPYNYNLEVVADAAAESDPEYGDSRITIIYSRWLPSDSLSEAQKLGRRLLNRYRDNPKTYKFKLDAKDSSIWTGDVVTATIRSVVDATGAALPTDMQVLTVQETVPGSEFEYTLQDNQFFGRYAFWAPDAEDDYTHASAADLKRYAWWASDAGVMSDGQPGYKYV